MDKQRKEMAGFVRMEPQPADFSEAQRLVCWWDEMYATEW